MSERYKQLFSLTNNLYAETSPVVIAAGALLKDTATGKILVQLKFRNIISKPIKALRVSIAPLDTRGEGLGEPIEHTYLDLSAERGDEFGQKVPVLLPDDETRAFSAAVTEVIFSDNTVWTAGGGEWMPIPPRQPLAVLLEDQELEKQFRLTYGENCRFRPVEYKDLWFCACGSLNTEADVLCAGCRAPKAAMVAPDIAALTAERDKRLAAEAEEAARQAAERARIEAEEKAAAEARAKKRKKMAAIILPIVFVVVVAWILVTQVFLPAKNYEAAEVLMETGEYTAAVEAFEALGNYKDSADRVDEAAYAEAESLLDAGKYIAAVKAFVALGNYKDSADRVDEARTFQKEAAYAEAESLMEDGEYTAAVEAFKALGDYKDSADKAVEAKIQELGLKTAAVGDYVTFGTYEQDNNTANGKEEIEWLVLDRQEDRILVISKYILDCRRYNGKSATWQSCTLREWLNDEFLNMAFSEEEQALIPTVRVSADKNPQYNDVNAGGDTRDQIFLLSVSEAYTYFASKEARACKSTDYAYANGLQQVISWWLRIPGMDESYACDVLTNGNINYSGNPVEMTVIGVRPALWINLNA